MEVFERVRPIIAARSVGIAQGAFSAAVAHISESEAFGQPLAANQGLQVIIAGAGGAAHLPGMLAAYTHLPVLGVPIESKVLKGVDSLLSIVQMPAGIPVPTLAIGEAGAKNAALSAVSILALQNAQLREKLLEFRRQQTEQVLSARLE